MSAQPDFERVFSLAKAAIASGDCRYRGVGHLEWNVSGRCTAPVWRELYGYRPRYAAPKGQGSRRKEWQPGESGPMRLELWLPCRRCRQCLRAKSLMWASRAEEECRISGRTWFVTLTLSAENHYLKLVEGAQKRPDRTEWEQRLAAIGGEVTRYLKRVRFESGAPLRYILVVEAHKSGLPHYHLLVHEPDPARRVLKETLEGQWRLGFSKAKLVGDARKGARYATKYLMKSSLARVRASRAYGIDALTAEVLLAETVNTHDPPKGNPPAETLGQEDRDRSEAEIPLW